MTRYIDADGYEWLPCLDGTFVAVDEDGYLEPIDFERLEAFFGPLTKVVEG
ncbi:hypothetical protein [Streptomyces sp. NPDC002644]